MKTMQGGTPGAPWCIAAKQYNGHELTHHTASSDRSAGQEQPSYQLVPVSHLHFQNPWPVSSSRAGGFSICIAAVATFRHSMFYR